MVDGRGGGGGRGAVAGLRHAQPRHAGVRRVPGVSPGPRLAVQQPQLVVHGRLVQLRFLVFTCQVT